MRERHHPSKRYVGLLLIYCLITGTLACERTPAGLSVPRTLGDGKFQVSINGDPDKYVPGAPYTVRIHGQTDQNSAEKFSGFLLIVESAEGHSTQGSAGTFRLKDDSLARYSSEFCRDVVKQASEVAKPEVQVLWTAPPSTAGCVIFRATIVKTQYLWFMNDGGLTKTLCPEDDVGQEENDVMQPCRACDEAKYEMTFEGLWSSLTHPRGFPTDAFVAQFSDLIGASHSPNFRFWEPKEVASEGLRHMAESGSMRYLESEFKNQSRNIRTIIKARGLRRSNYNGLKTFAVFRADKEHNLISFVSKIDPSPDWFVGVSRINLCLGNGSWVANRVINLLPWDAGTDSGIRYSDPDIPTIPRDRIHKIVWSKDKDSPFYDLNGNSVKPFAKLRIQQQRTYKRSSCGETSRQPSEFNEEEFYDESPDRDRPECSMSAWSAWTPCSESCGKGVRRRFRTYVNEPISREFGCNRTDTTEQYCYNSQFCKGQPSSYYDTKLPSLSSIYENGGHSGGYNEEDSILPDPRDDVCGTTEWSPWSVCSDPCGTGIRYQYRTFLQPRLAAMHGCDLTESLQKKGRCPVTPECAKVEEVTEPGCEVSGWGPWSECPVTCGMGTRTRSRYWKYPTDDHRKCKTQLQMYDSCIGVIPNCPPEKSKEDCLEPKLEGECRNNYTRWYFDQVKMRCLRFEFTGCKKTRNNFESEEECKSVCDVLRENMSTTGVRSHTRHSKQGGENSWGSFQAMSPTHRQSSSGHSSSSLHSHHRDHRTSTQSSHYPSSVGNIKTNHYQQVLPAYNDGPSVDCRVSPWSAWSECSVDCGRGWKHQRRYVLVANQNGGRPCPEPMEKSRRCRGDCPPNHPYGRNLEHEDYNYQD